MVFTRHRFQIRHFSQRIACRKHVKDGPQFAELAQARDQLTALSRQAIGLFTSGDTQGAIVILSTKVRPVGLVYSQGVTSLIDAMQKEQVAAHEREIAAYHETLFTMIGVIVIVGALAALYAGLQIRAIGSSMTEIQTTVEAVSKTLDLTRRVSVKRLDEIGRTATAFNGLVDRLGTVLGSISHSVDSVSTASRQIAAGNLDLSARTEQQAASLEETSASMSELTQTVTQNAENAREANGVATSAADLADNGHRAVQQMLNTIDEINQSANKISDITGLIEGIAFQTNILALNAAVEAARAGEQGRGFAVVASEVRSLAQRSASAAKEIKQLIEASVTLVRDGSVQASTVGATVGEVRTAIKRVSDIVGEISAASEEQSRGIGQIGNAVVQMDQVTQQNAALVEEAAAAAQSLDSQATSMKEAVSAFRFEEGRRAA